jgi:hypothetical protein
MTTNKEVRTMSIATPLWRAAVIALALGATSVVVACGGKVNQPSGQATSTTKDGKAQIVAPDLSGSELSRLVAAASHIKKVPADITPVLTAAPTDFEDLTAAGRCAKGTTAPELGKCVHGDPKGDKLAVLYGDSHAGMWLTALDAAATRAHWRLILMSHAGCPAPDLTYVDEKGKVKADCATFRKQAAARMQALKPNLLVATSASPGQRIEGNRVASSAEWQTAWAAALKDLRVPGEKQVLLGDMPVLTKVNPDCLAAHMSSVQSCSAPRTTALQGVQLKAEARAAKAVGARYVNVISWFCSDVCSPVIGDTGVYRNQFHTTAAFGRLVSGPMGRALDWSTTA